MADALVSPAVAVTSGVIAGALLVVAARKIRHDHRDDLVAKMGVLGAFVFAAQMINFTIPGTGSSGHIIGGILLAAILGPWAGFLTLCSVLIIQCLVFADGGLMALGCNILNMGALSCLVAYPLLFRPFIKGGKVTATRLMTASILSSTVGLLLGALAVTLETEASGITALPIGRFLMFMLPIHLVIGLCEGVGTGMVLSIVVKAQPGMLYTPFAVDAPGADKAKMGRVLVWLGAVAVILAVSFTWIASSNPDGLEWSIAKIADASLFEGGIEPPTAVMPDYNSYFAGLVGSALVILSLWGVTSAVRIKSRK